MGSSAKRAGVKASNGGCVSDSFRKIQTWIFEEPFQIMLACKTILLLGQVVVLRVIQVLSQLIEWRSKSRIIRRYNGSEFISHEHINRANENGIQLEYIQPRQPQQNAYVERLNRTIRYSWVRKYLFENLEEVQEHATKELSLYNHERPHKANGGLPPFAETA